MAPSARQYRDYSTVNDTLTYYVVALYGTVESAASNPVTVIIDSVANEDELAASMAHGISVAPNPFLELAVISYELSKASEIEIKIYNIRGQLVRRLFAGDQAKGEQHQAWEGCDDDARYLPAGVYLMQMRVDGAARKPTRILKL
jgi:flagellar hook assembly protein FlgD